MRDEFLAHLVTDIRRHERQDVHVIRHVRFVDHRHDILAGKHIPDAAGSQAVSFRERTGNDEMRILLEEPRGRLAIELDVSFIDEERAGNILGDVLDLVEREALPVGLFGLQMTASDAFSSLTVRTNASISSE